MLVALPTPTLQPLQRVRQVFGLSRFEHVTPTLIQLHWLPVSYRIKFKLCCLVQAINYGRSPAYLTETVQSVGASRSVAGHAHLLPRRLTTLYHGCAQSVPDRQFVRAVSEALRYLAQPGELAATSARTGVGAAHARPSVVAAVPGGSSSPVGVVVVHRRRSARLHIVSTRRHHGCGG